MSGQKYKLFQQFNKNSAFLCFYLKNLNQQLLHSCWYTNYYDFCDSVLVVLQVGSLNWKYYTKLAPNFMEKNLIKLLIPSTYVFKPHLPKIKKLDLNCLVANFWEYVLKNKLKFKK